MPDRTATPVLDTVVLAGGGSSRLGQDKVVVEVAGQRQVDRVVQAVAPLGGQVLLASGRALPDVVGPRVVIDDPDLAGPLAGIVAGLEAATTALVAVLAVDLVAPSAPLLAALAREVARTGAPGAVPVEAGRWQHLHAVLRRDLGPILATEDHRSVRAALAAAGVTGIPEHRWRRWAPQARPSDDIDTPDDLARARIEAATDSS